MNGDREWRWRGRGKATRKTCHLGDAVRRSREREQSRGKKVSRGEKTECIEKREERGER